MMKRFLASLVLVLGALVLVGFLAKDMPTVAQTLGVGQVKAYCYYLCDDTDCANDSCLMYDTGADEWCVDNACACDGDCTGHSTVSPQGCEDTQTGVIQFSDGSGGLACWDELYTLIGGDPNLYLHDRTVGVDDDKQLLITVDPDLRGAGDDKGTAVIVFSDVGADNTELVTSFDFKSEGALHFEPCCTTAEFGADCRYPQPACVASAEGMDIIGDLTVCGLNFGCSPWRVSDAVRIETSLSVHTTLDDISGDLVITPTGGDTDITGTLTVDGSVEIDVDGTLNYGAGNQTIIENQQFPTPFDLKLLAATNSYQFYAFGLALTGFDGVGGTEDWFRTNSGGTTVETLLSTGDVIAGSVASAAVLTDAGSVELDEKAAASADAAGVGQYWVKDDAPNTAWFTDDTGTDFQLGIRAHAAISAQDNATATTISVAGTAVQVTIFDTDGPEYIDDGDNTSDDITITTGGTYLVASSATVNSIAGAASRFEMTVQKNNGASSVDALHVDRNLGGGAAESGSVSMSGIAVLSAADTIEVWLENETNTQNYVVENITLSAVRIR